MMHGFACTSPVYQKESASISIGMDVVILTAAGRIRDNNGCARTYSYRRFHMSGTIIVEIINACRRIQRSGVVPSAPAILYKYMEP